MAEYSTFNKVHIYDPNGNEETRKFEVDAKNVIVPDGHPGGGEDPSRDDYEKGPTDLATELEWLRNTTLTYDNLDESYFTFKASTGNPEIKKWQIESSQLISVDKLADLIKQDQQNASKINVAPLNHAVPNTRHGVGSYENYGHVRTVSIGLDQVRSLNDIKNNTFTIEGISDREISSSHILDAGTISLLYQSIVTDRDNLQVAVDNLESKSQNFESEADYEAWVSTTTAEQRANVTCFVNT